VTIRLAIGHYLPIVILWNTACISSRFRDNGHQTYWGHDFDLSGSRDVIVTYRPCCCIERPNYEAARAWNWHDLTCIELWEWLFLVTGVQLVIVSLTITTYAISWFDSWHCCIASHAMLLSFTSDVEVSDVSSPLWTLSSTGRSATPSQRSSSRADIDSLITVEARAFVALGHEAH